VLNFTKYFEDGEVPMATPVLMPKQGQSVESCIITRWLKKVGDPVAEGEALCEVETDKALLEVSSPASGTVLALFFQEGDEVPVLATIAAVGQPGEELGGVEPSGATLAPAPDGAKMEKGVEAGSPVSAVGTSPAVPPPVLATDEVQAISPRARNLARQKGVETRGLQGSGPGGRLIERDIQAALAEMPRMTPLAKTMVAQGGYQAPNRGSGVGGRVMARDLTATATEPEARGPISPEVSLAEEEVEIIPLKGTRKVIATRMLESLQTTAQLTLNASADARALLTYRQRLKGSAEALGLQKVTINDLILFAVSRVLLQHLELNTLFAENTISRYKNVHLGFAVDAPRGLIVPVIRQAQTLSLKQISETSKRLAMACIEGTISPDDLKGGTFTVSNLGNFGIESFTPLLNPPQVAILGVGNINLKPVEVEGEVQFIPHLGLSLTINHQVVDGAPGARFLQTLSQGLAQIELLLAV
jgi:pyruvate dehydrogenase E2 component (dihydrolipoamide acetyltransferase)